MEHILSFSAKYDMLPQGGLILVALSGGGDSVALLHFLKARGFPVAAAHFNHHLRENAQRDAEFCQALCKSWDVPFFTWGARVGDLPGNTEANARKARYDYLERLAGRLHAARIATAHTASDNLETLLLHLTRGCGLQGLTGIQPRRDKLVRPMLHTTRCGVEAYLKEHSLPYVTDETNLDDRYSRNRIRHQVIPVLETLNPKVTEAAIRLMDALREDEEFLSALGEKAGETADTWEDLENLPPPLRYRVLRQTRLDASGTPLGRLLDASGTPLGRLLDASGTPWEPPLEPWLTPGETLPVPLGEAVDTPLYTLLAQAVDAAPDSPANPSHFFLKPLGGMALRTRRPGDYLRPPHRGGKTVKKWMNELKVPKNQRNLVPVLTFQDEILSVAGLGPQERYLASPGEAAYEISWIKKPK